MLNPIRRPDSQSVAPDTPAHGQGEGGGPPSFTTSNVRRSLSLRKLVGVAAMIAFAINLALAQLTLSDARGGDVSAVQIIQIWTPHIYYAVLITGVAIALYIYSRAEE